MGVGFSLHGASGFSLEEGTMYDPSKIARWREVEASLRAILERETLSDDWAERISEYLDHNELGLSWDELRAQDDELSAESRRQLREVGNKMGLLAESEHDLYERALALPEGPQALTLWTELAALGNPDAPDELRRYARSGDARLSDPAREALEAMELSHDDPMP